ncbi:MAG: ThiF family adenylyltransferase [Pseudomonas putida]|jgi:hypothetical protein|nr:ThiF family adenylyltransferase [Pseudomonas putida]
MDDLIFFENGNPLGLIAPSTLHADHQGFKYISGPKGIYRLQDADESSLHDALLSAGALIPGTEADITAVQDALRNPATSRTVSYLLCNATSCADVVDDLSALHDANIVIAGCGGIGSAVALLLAGGGIKNLTLIDPDVIEKSNLNRQLFWTLDDIGQPKVSTLKKALEQRFEGLSITVEQCNVTIDDLIERCTSGVQGLAVTADSPGTLASESRRVCEECNIPVISGSYMHDAMLLFSFIPQNAYPNIQGNAPRLDWQRLPSSIMPSYGPMNLSLAADIANRILASLAINTLNKPIPSIKKWKIDEVPMILNLET